MGTRGLFNWREGSFPIPTRRCDFPGSFMTFSLTAIIILVLLRRIKSFALCKKDFLSYSSNFSVFQRKKFFHFPTRSDLFAASDLHRPFYPQHLNK
jgi:hypothetical protein